MKRAIVLQSARRGLEPTMTARRGKTDEEQIAWTLRAARLFVGDSDEPLSAEEAAAMEELRRELPRPTQAEIEALAKKLAGSTSSSND